MTRSELAWIINIPIPCGNCGKEGLERAANLVELTEYPCSSCGALLDLNTSEWANFRNHVEKFSIGVFAPVAPVKKLP